MEKTNNNGAKVLCAFIQALQGRVTAKDYKRITGGELSEHAKKYALGPMIVAGGVFDASTLASAIDIGQPNYLR